MGQQHFNGAAAFPRRPPPLYYQPHERMAGVGLVREPPRNLSDFVMMKESLDGEGERGGGREGGVARFCWV